MHLKTLATPALAAAVILTGAISSGAAQDTRRLADAESVPLELATALAGTFGFGSEPQILVGSMPESATNRLLVPRGGRLIGSGFSGSSLVVVVIAMPTGADSAVASLRTELLQHGWNNPPPQASYGSGGGFRPAQLAPNAAATESAKNGPLCGDQQMLMLSGARRRTGGSTITYRLYTGSAFNACHPVQSPPQVYQTPFPTLYNPASADNSFNPAGCTGNYASSGTSTTLRAAMTSEALLEHYSKQIVDSGWTVGKTIVGRVWTRRDSTGSPREMLLVITPSSQSADCVRLDLNVRTSSKP